MSESVFNAPEFALRIRLKMAEQNLSYRHLADQIGVGQANIHRAAKKALSPSVETYLRIVRWLDTATDISATVRRSPIMFHGDFRDAAMTQRFNIGDEVSHNAGIIDAESKRRISGVIGYDRNGGFQYRIGLIDGTDRGLAYDDELDPWPDGVFLPAISPRVSA